MPEGEMALSHIEDQESQTGSRITADKMAA